MILFVQLCYKFEFYFILFIFLKFTMTKQTLSNKSRYSILKVSGFRARMLTSQGRKVISNRRKKGRKQLTLKR